MNSSKLNNWHFLLYSGAIIAASVLVNELICHTFIMPDMGRTGSPHVALVAFATSTTLLFVGFLFWFHNKKKELTTINSEWENTFNSLSEFISIHDRDFRIIKANRSLCDLFGKTERELRGKYCYEIFHNASAPIPDCPHTKAMETQDSISTEIYDNALGIPLHITCSPFVNEKGAFLGSIHVARPITGSVLSAVKTKQSEKNDQFLSVCAWCKDVSGKDGIWGNLFDYVYENTPIQYTHSICPDCRKKVQPVINN